MVGKLHVITDTTHQQRYSHAELAERAIAGGADTIQYRSKSASVQEMIQEAGGVLEVCKAANIPLLVNDRVDVCLAVNADGVHLGLGDMPIAIARSIIGAGKLIGGTARNIAHVLDAARAGADYVGLGPIFGTSSKTLDVLPLGLELVRDICAASSIPVIGIGGISAVNIGRVVSAGVHGVAVIQAVTLQRDVTAAAQELMTLMAKP